MKVFEVFGLLRLSIVTISSLSMIKNFSTSLKHGTCDSISHITLCCEHVRRFMLKLHTLMFPLLIICSSTISYGI